MQVFKKGMYAFLTALLFLTVSCSCTPQGQEDRKGPYTVVFDCDGGSPVPAPQQIERGGFVTEPSEKPVRGTSTFSAWYTQSGLKFNFKSTPVTKDITLVAHYWDGPKKYIIINDYDWSYLENTVHSHFGSPEGKDVAVGQGVLFYLFQRPLEAHTSTLRNHLKYAVQYDVPLLIQLDPVTFWDAVPEIWNWFDEKVAGYDPANRDNVEWYGWGNQYAVKLGWLNWGRQIRLKPMANVFSPVYQAAVKERMDAMLSIVDEWYRQLPDNKKYLLAGIKITGELGIGVNNWYYTGGNDLYDKDAAGDPTYGINLSNFPSRAKVDGTVSTIGYAGLTASGIKTSGEVTGDDIAELEHRFTLFVSQIARRYSFPRELVFAHAGGGGKDLDACINDLVCPSWSFYGSNAADAKNATYCMQLLKDSDAPAWGIAEWALSSDKDDVWANAIRNALLVDRLRFLSIYTNVIGNNNGTAINNAAVTGIRTIQNEKF